MRVRLGGLAVLLAMVATPAGANAASTVVTSDGCGDVSEAIAYANGISVPVPSERTAAHDIADSTLTAVPGGGVDAELRMCGAIPAPERDGGFWQVGANVGNDCVIAIALGDDPIAQVTREASISVDCTTVEQNQLGGYTVTSRETFRSVLPVTAWSVSGSTITWHISPQRLHAANVGSTWTVPYAYSWDGRRLTEANQDPRFGFNGPGVRDDAHGTGTLELE